ncbi:unnamed protein product [Caenorhabditis auriculariae]|uniref:Uncharacterized protein n=1 Tax=Caenorhabditis auriculariae TaxID=2777116 RepID=A0A8S1HSJ7_9PELO|nr:unnamed protein product [Caenorhabditis auriculariae]
MPCSGCCRSMNLIARPKLIDQYEWRCAYCCSRGLSTGRKSVRGDSWFIRSNLRLSKILRLGIQWSSRPFDTYEEIEARVAVTRSSIGNYYRFFGKVCQHWCRRTAEKQGNQEIKTEIDLKPELDVAAELGGDVKPDFKCTRRGMAMPMGDLNDELSEDEFSPNVSIYLFRLIHLHTKIFQRLLYELYLMDPP